MHMHAKKEQEVFGGRGRFLVLMLCSSEKPNYLRVNVTVSKGHFGAGMTVGGILAPSGHQQELRLRELQERRHDATVHCGTWCYLQFQVI